MPRYLDGLPNVTIGHDMPGVLQRVNPLATRTTLGCPRRCGFCGIGNGKIEAGGFRELADWPDLPILCDNNLLACSRPHFDRVIDRLIRHAWADFNQGLDCRLLSEYHAKRIAEIRKPICRLALDSDAEREPWWNAFQLLRNAGIAKKRIHVYCVIGWHDTPAEAKLKHIDGECPQHGVPYIVHGLQKFCCVCECEKSGKMMAELAAEHNRYLDIVSKLPRTADGVHDANAYYSSKEAAESARSGR